MTVPFQFNLARGRVIPLSQRRHWYVGLFWYLGCMGVVMAVMAYLLATSWIDVRRKADAIAGDEKAFLGRHPGQTSVAGIAAGLGERMALCAAGIEAARTFIARDSRVAPAIMALKKPLPRDVEIGHLEWTPEKTLLSVCVPVDRRSGDDFAPSKLIAAWSADAILRDTVGEIGGGSSQRAKVGGVDVNSWRFDATRGSAR